MNELNNTELILYTIPDGEIVVSSALEHTPQYTPVRGEHDINKRTNIMQIKRANTQVRPYGNATHLPRNKHVIKKLLQF